MAPLRLLAEQIREIETARLQRLEQQPNSGTHRMVRVLAQVRGLGIETADMLSATTRPSARCGAAIGRKNYLIAGSDAGGRRAAAMYSPIETAKLNGVNPQANLADVLARIADHPAERVAELLPWNWQPANPARAAA